jgi:Phage portal protein
MGVRSRLKHAYNAFLNRDPINSVAPYSGGHNTELGAGSSFAPMRSRFGFSGERTITSSIYTRISVDAASVDIRHVKKDEQDRYLEDIKSGLHNCLNVEANVDQTGRGFLQDLYMTLLEGGHIAVLPVDMSKHPKNGGLFDIETWRVGIVVQWFPRFVTIEAYNDRTGRREQTTVDKRHVGLIENPFYDVMNMPNSTLARLKRKLALLDTVDEKVNSSKLDILIQLPFPIRNEGRRADAELRRQEIETQLKDSSHGIAYIDATEKVTQLNRPIENTLLPQVERLLVQLYSELGLTQKVMDGTAEEAEMINYYNRTIEPLISSVADELKRKFLTKTARTQGHDVVFFRDPFKLVPMKDLAELADKFTRNEIVTSNEFRGFIGMRPVIDDPKADMLINSNLTVDQSRVQAEQVDAKLAAGEGEIVDGEIVEEEEEEDAFAEVNAVLDDTFKMLGVEG